MEKTHKQVENVGCVSINTPNYQVSVKFDYFDVSCGITNTIGSVFLNTVMLCDKHTVYSVIDYYNTNTARDSNHKN